MVTFSSGRRETTGAKSAHASDTPFFPGFERSTIETSSAVIHTVHGGSGPPLLLLHGSPQTHVMWHKVAPRLAEHFTVVMTDLRGYGDSSKPATPPVDRALDTGAGPFPVGSVVLPHTARRDRRPHEPHGGPWDGERHGAYSKRAMAQDQIEVMRGLGFDRFAVVGHDRGARVTWRLAVENPDVITRAAVLDIVPLPYSLMTREFATEYFHWFFLIQPEPLPEALIGANPEAWLRSRFHDDDGITPEAFAEYLRCYTPEAIHGNCEDYRAGATIDLEHSSADGERTVACPLLVLWGKRSTVGRLYDVMEIWRMHAEKVHGHALPARHFVAEEAPKETLAALLPFLTEG